jgi:prepilin-type N-terminal cleavage/methylation domain-containing protein
LVIGHSKRAFSLIEMIGVLAVLAILAAALVPPFIRQMDKVAGDQESAALKSFGDALQQSIMRKRYIPGSAEWAAQIATELGAEVASVTNSPRRQPRFFLIDPALRIGDNSSGLPYAQTNWVFGSVVTTNAEVIIPPLSPRVMILSSIGRALPAGVVSGVASSANFTNIWNSTDGTVPTAAPVFAGWSGSGDDLKVQRIDLSPLFVPLQLSFYAPRSTCCPRYAIDPINPTNSAAATSVTGNIKGYFVHNSVLALYTHELAPDSQQILIRGNSFVYDQNVWRGSGGFLVGGLDIAKVVDDFLAAFPNAQAQNGAGQQPIVVQSMINYMDRYSEWAAANFPYNSGTAPTYIAVVNAQAAMKTAVQGQYLANTYDPDEVPCQ